MRNGVQLVLLSTAVAFALAHKCPAQAQAERNDAKTHRQEPPRKSDGKHAEPALAGIWRADSVSMALPDGSRKTLAGSDRPMCLIFSEKTCTMWLGDTIVSSTSYSLDPKHDPWTIDMKSKEDVLLGICAKKDDNLTISLDDRGTGRPRDFDKEKHGMVFVLRQFRGVPLQVMNADGGNRRPFPVMSDYTSCGSPRWSRDGRKLVLDGWRSWAGENYYQSHVLVVNADGSGPKDLGDGTLPSMSPDGKKIAYIRFGANYGVWIMDADGTNKESIHQGSGTGESVDWSPKKAELAYSTNEPNPYGGGANPYGGGANLCVLDLKTRESRALLKKKYQQIHWGFAWSPDGKWIAFLGILPGGRSEVAVVHAQGQAKGFRVLLSEEKVPDLKKIDGYISWRPDGKQFLIGLKMGKDVNTQLYCLDMEGKAPPRKLAGQDAAQTNFIPAWSPDGKTIVYAYAKGTRPTSQKVEKK